MSFPKGAIVITTLGKRPTTIQMADTSDDGSYFSDGSGAKKRRRLTHLSADEKILRRKLKNRVAAQTARDRKKAQMQELEEKVAQLEQQKRQLEKENAQLRVSHSAIQKENALLRSQVSSSSQTTTSPPSATIPNNNNNTDLSNPNLISTSSPSTTTTTSASLLVPFCKQEKVEQEEEEEEMTTTTKASVADCPPVMSCKTEPEFPGSAAPAVSLPKEQIQALSRVMMHYAACALTLSLMLCFISWKNSGGKTVETSSSRKRKQAKPARRPSVSSENTTPTPTSPPSTPRTPTSSSLKASRHLRPRWWGPQRQTWTPSMN